MLVEKLENILKVNPGDHSIKSDAPLCSNVRDVNLKLNKMCLASAYHLAMRKFSSCLTLLKKWVSVLALGVQNLYRTCVFGGLL